MSNCPVRAVHVMPKTVAATTVFSTPDKWTQKASETCRVILQLLINNTNKVASCWFSI